MPFALAGLVTVMVWQAMTRLYVALVPVQPLLSVTVTTIGNVPVWVGVPERTPLAASVRPAGSEPEASVYVTVPMVLELVKVSLFLSSFSGLYFTVSAVTDETYRGQFFATVTQHLERAVGVRAVYLALREQEAFRAP